MIFEWDLNKELENIKKHGIDFTEAQEVFIDPNVIHLEDEKHSHEEDRIDFMPLAKQEKAELSQQDILLEKIK